LSHISLPLSHQAAYKSHLVKETNSALPRTWKITVYVWYDANAKSHHIAKEIQTADHYSVKGKYFPRFRMQELEKSTGSAGLKSESKARKQHKGVTYTDKIM